MDADDFLAALDATLETSSPPGLEPSDKVALAVYWLVDRLAAALDVDPHVAALEIARSAETAADLMVDGESENDFLVGSA